MLDLWCFDPAYAVSDLQMVRTFEFFGFTFRLVRFAQFSVCQTTDISAEVDHTGKWHAITS